MELPYDIIQIIRQFAQPITRPDWRHLHRLTNEQFYKHLLPYHTTRYKVDGGIIHIVCLRNIQMKILVQKREMQITLIDKIET